MTKVEQQQSLEEARAAGIDLDLLDLNLSLSVAERWRQHQEAVELVEELEAARKVRDDAIRTASTAHL